LVQLWSDEFRETELTVCFETAFDVAIQQKTNRYTDLRDKATQNGYQANILPIEVGSRGMVHVQGCGNFSKKLNEVGLKEWRAFLVDLAQTAIAESHKIWCQRNWREQQN